MLQIRDHACQAGSPVLSGMANTANTGSLRLQIIMEIDQNNTDDSAIGPATILSEQKSQPVKPIGYARFPAGASFIRLAFSCRSFLIINFNNLR